MDGDFLHQLLAARSRAEGTLSSCPQPACWHYPGSYLTARRPWPEVGKLQKGKEKEREKQLGNRMQIPFSPKKLKVVMFQQWLSYPLWPAKCYGYIQPCPLSWFCILACLCQDTEAMVGGVQFCCAALVLDTSEVKNGSCVWKKVTVKDNARYTDC